MQNLRPCSHFLKMAIFKFWNGHFRELIIIYTQSILQKLLLISCNFWKCLLLFQDGYFSKLKWLFWENGCIASSQILKIVGNSTIFYPSFDTHDSPGSIIWKSKFTIGFVNTVFPHIVAAVTILFWKLKWGNYSREETIQGRKLLFSYFLEGHTYS